MARGRVESRRLTKLAERAVAAHAAADQAEDALFGAGRRGDEVPPEAWRPRRRDERIAAALASLRAEREAAERAEAERAEENLARARAASPGRASALAPPGRPGDGGRAQPGTDRVAPGVGQPDPGVSR